ncbi:hypothetical protein B0H34DRAFT_302876 [Crassisporium funariophilum]|nr:hypothetical protein B0H34DRAFT_302876 [Crassisporium funariophilum]
MLIPIYLHHRQRGEDAWFLFQGLQSSSTFTHSRSTFPYQNRSRCYCCSFMTFVPLVHSVCFGFLSICFSICFSFNSMASFIIRLCDCLLNSTSKRPNQSIYLHSSGFRFQISLSHAKRLSKQHCLMIEQHAGYLLPWLPTDTRLSSGHSFFR